MRGSSSRAAGRGAQQLDRAKVKCASVRPSGALIVLGQRWGLAPRWPAGGAAATVVAVAATTKNRGTEKFFGWWIAKDSGGRERAVAKNKRGGGSRRDPPADRSSSGSVADSRRRAGGKRRSFWGWGQRVGRSCLQGFGLELNVGLRLNGLFSPFPSSRTIAYNPRIIQ